MKPRRARGVEQCGGRAPRGARGLKLVVVGYHDLVPGRAPRGARGLKPLGARRENNGPCRAPRGARGLKLDACCGGRMMWLSRPARGAWIETWPARCRSLRRSSRPARGAWIETAKTILYCGGTIRRAPRGARGLKRGCNGTHASAQGSRPARGAWIETAVTCSANGTCAVAPRAGRVD